MRAPSTADQEDVDGKGPKEFFSGTEEEMAEFEADAKAKVAELAALLAEREEEFYSYQNAPAAADDDVRAALAREHVRPRRHQSQPASADLTAPLTMCAIPVGGFR